LLKKGIGSSPVKGNVSDNQIHKILKIPKSTLTDWKNSDTYKKQLYWFLKSMNKVELSQYKEVSKDFINS
jgi:hypothetical protein